MENQRMPPVAPSGSASAGLGGDTSSSPQPDPIATLGESDLLLIREATIRRKAIKNAAATARTSAAVTLVLGILAVLFVLVWPSWQSAVMAVGLCAVGTVEYLGHRKMRQADPAAARLLGRNQLAFLALIVLYCVVQMVSFSPEQARAAALSAESRSQLDAMPSMAKDIDSQIDRWAPLVVYSFYGLVIVLSGAFQGGLAAYYFTRRRHLEAFNRDTPAWVRQVIAETGA